MGATTLRVLLSQEEKKLPACEEDTLLRRETFIIQNETKQNKAKLNKAFIGLGILCLQGEWKVTLVKARPTQRIRTDPGRHIAGLQTCQPGIAAERLWGFVSVTL